MNTGLTTEQLHWLDRQSKHGPCQRCGELGPTWWFARAERTGIWTCLVCRELVKRDVPLGANAVPQYGVMRQSAP